MSSTALYKAFIEVGASGDSATKAAEDVIQVSQLPQLATKADIARLETNMAKQETRLLKWIVGCGFLFTCIVIAGVGLLIPNHVVPRCCSVSCMSGDRPPLITCGGMLEIFPLDQADPIPLKYPGVRVVYSPLQLCNVRPDPVFPRPAQRRTCADPIPSQTPCSATIIDNPGRRA